MLCVRKRRAGGGRRGGVLKEGGVRRKLSGGCCGSGLKFSASVEDLSPEPLHRCLASPRRLFFHATVSLKFLLLPTTSAGFCSGPRNASGVSQTQVGERFPQRPKTPASYDHCSCNSMVVPTSFSCAFSLFYAKHAKI